MSRRWEEATRDVLTSAGFSEVIAYSLTSEERLARVPRASTADGHLRDQPGGSAAGDNAARFVAMVDEPDCVTCRAGPHL